MKITKEILKQYENFKNNVYPKMSTESKQMFNENLDKLGTPYLLAVIKDCYKLVK